MHEGERENDAIPSLSCLTMFMVQLCLVDDNHDYYLKALKSGMLLRDAETEMRHKQVGKESTSAFISLESRHRIQV